MNNQTKIEADKKWDASNQMDYSATCGHCGDKQVTVNSNCICRPCFESGVRKVVR